MDGKTLYENLDELLLSRDESTELTVQHGPWQGSGDDLADLITEAFDRLDDGSPD